jgi:hypothetical protein
MARTESAMLALGTQIPAFSLKDVRSNQLHTQSSLMGPKGLLVMFICCHCPFVKHVEKQLAQLAVDFRIPALGLPRFRPTMRRTIRTTRPPRSRNKL